MERKPCSQRIREGLAYANMTQTDLSKRTGIPKSAISQYISGVFEPKQDRLYLIATVLGVSEAWLMGFDVPMIKQKTPSIPDGKKELIDTIMRELLALSDEKQQEVLRYIRFVANG